MLISISKDMRSATAHSEPACFLSFSSENHDTLELGQAILYPQNPSIRLSSFTHELRNEDAAELMAE